MRVKTVKVSYTGQVCLSEIDVEPSSDFDIDINNAIINPKLFFSYSTSTDSVQTIGLTRHMVN